MFGLNGPLNEDFLGAHSECRVLRYVLERLLHPQCQRSNASIDLQVFSFIK